MFETTISRKRALEIGLKQYYSGVPCKRGHLAARFASNGTCVACDAEAQKGRPSRRPLKPSRPWNEVYYWRAEPCKRGHTAPWRISDGICTACHSEWRARNKITCETV